MTLKEAFERALNADRRSEHQVARAIYDDILAANPEHPGALLGIARQMRVRSDRAGARAMLGRAFESAQARRLPMCELWGELGTLEPDARNLAAARFAYGKALAVGPGLLPALL